MMKFVPQIPLPNLRGRVRVVHQAAEETVLIIELLPIGFRIERWIRVAIATAWLARPFPALERERLQQFDAQAAGETKRTAITGRKHRIAPQQMPLRSRPNPMDDPKVSVFFQVVPIAIAQEIALCFGGRWTARAGRRRPQL